MAHIKVIPKVKLIIGIMYKDEDICAKMLKLLKIRFGKILDSLQYDFTFTDYYDSEMGNSLKKIILVFKRQISRQRLSSIKNFTNKLEDQFSEQGNRKINIDPGYMTMHNVVLASAKELPHRLYIGKGMFGDVVLTFKDNEFHHSDHTFPDYKSQAVKDFLKKWRS